MELINGLVSLVHQPNMADMAQEAMDALLVLHQPEKIEMWNPEAPINTFWDVRLASVHSNPLRMSHQKSFVNDKFLFVNQFIFGI